MEKKKYRGPMLSCPEARGCRQKDSKLGVFVSTEMGILGHWVFWGRVNIIFHYIVVP